MMCHSRFFVRDGALVADFKDALQPMVWRMELSRVHAVGFKVQQNGSTWDLGMEGTAGNFAPIASFANEAAARKALHGIGCGLRQQGFARRGFKSLMTILLAIVVAGIVYSFGSMLLGGSGGDTRPPVAEVPMGKSMSAGQALRAPAP